MELQAVIAACTQLFEGLMGKKIRIRGLARHFPGDGFVTLLAAIDSRLARFVREGAAGAIKFGEFVRLQQHRNCFQR